ncbi:MAG: bacteriophage spanin2 family protein [Shimia sp.]|uniref:bacteriophage spanin2 family protein n=1 Tax=Shimia sp. TaxID=1954381 RepID=UPI003B8BAAAE
MLIVVLLSSCGGAGALKLLAGGSPNVAANVQAGKINSQTIGETEIKNQRIRQTTARDIRQTSDTNQVRADKVERIVVNEQPIWLWIALIFALFLDSPLRWPQQAFRASQYFRQKPR